MENKQLKWFAGVLFLAFVLAMFVWTASLTLEVMGIVLPHSPAVQWFALAVFDGGVATWVFTYTMKARGTQQRGASLLMALVDFAGVGLMAAAGIYLGGQELVDIPQWMAQWVINGVIGATVLNLGFAYFYHANTPDVIEAIQAQDLEDLLSEEALKQARRNVEIEAQRLGAIMARRVTARIKYRLALPMSETESAEWNGETVDATAQDVPQLPFPANADVPAWLLGVLRFFGRGQNRPQPSESIPTLPNTDSNSNDQPQDPNPPA